MDSAQRGAAVRGILRELVRRELARTSFRDYLALVHGPLWIPTRFSTFLADEVQAFLETRTGNAYDILIVETPPQHGKSMTLTESLPSWRLMKEPETRVILASYNDESAEKFARRNREKLLQWGPHLFGVSVGGLNRATEFELDGHRGRLISPGMKTTSPPASCGRRIMSGCSACRWRRNRQRRTRTPWAGLRANPCVRNWGRMRYGWTSSNAPISGT